MWSNPQFSADLVTLTEEILDENFIFLWSVELNTQQKETAVVFDTWEYKWANRLPHI